MSDFYETLGVAEDATKEEIKQAYRQLARDHHPDVNKDDTSADFAEINKAYSTLSDEEKRREYDRRRQDDGESDFCFSNGTININFGGFSYVATKAKRRNSTLRIQVKMTPKQLLTGATKEITYDRIVGCSTCKGSGRNKDEVCFSCGGRGFIQERIQKTINIPPGVNAAPFLLAGEGGREFESLPPGDLLITPVVQLPQDVTIIQGGMIQTIGVDPNRFLVGGKIEIETPFEETISYELPETFQFGGMDSIPNMGLPRELGNPNDREKLIVKFVPERPEKITEEQRELLRRYLDLDR